MNIVTTLCTDRNDRSYNYQLYYQSNEERRKTYWKCAVTFFASAKKIYPEQRLILFTNDEKPVIINRTDIRGFLKSLGVEIRTEAYTYRPPARFSSYLTNNFYKFETIRLLGMEDSPSVLLDSDVFFTKRDEHFVNLVEAGETLLYDVYQKSDPGDRSNNHISRRDQGMMFREIDPEYPVEYPVFWGGEIISGSPAVFQAIDQEFQKIFRYAIDHYENPPAFPSGRGFFDGNETIGNFIFNKIIASHVDASQFIKRIWTVKGISEITPAIVDLPLWHMISEKDKGIPLLFDEALNPDSGFWTTPIDDFKAYLGGYLGVPERLHEYERPGLHRTFLPRVKN